VTVSLVGLAILTQDVAGETITQENVSPGFIGLAFFLSLGLGTFLLWRSLNKQLKRIDFDEGVQPGDAIDVRDSTRAASAATGAESSETVPPPVSEDDEGR
jgi:hypothetical protein